MRLAQQYAVSSIVLGIDEVLRQLGFITAELQKEKEGVYTAPIASDRVCHRITNPTLFAGVFNLLPTDVFRFQTMVCDDCFSVKLTFDLRYSWTLQTFDQAKLLSNAMELLNPEKRKMNFLKQVAMLGRKPNTLWAAPRSDDALFGRLVDAHPARMKSPSPDREPSYMRKRDGLMPCQRRSASSQEIVQYEKEPSPVKRPLTRLSPLKSRPDVFEANRVKHRLDPISREEKGAVVPGLRR